MPNFGGGIFGGELFGQGASTNTGTSTTTISSLPPDKTLCDIVRQILDQTAGDIFWPATQIYDAANEALVDLWAWANIQTASEPLSVGVGDDIVAYNTSTIMIPKFIVLSTHIANADVNQKYFITDQTKLEQWSRVWRLDAIGQPKWFVLWDLFHLRVYPSPDKTYTFTLWGVPWPTEVTAANEDVLVDRQLKLAIAYRTAANLVEQTRPDLADAYAKESDETLYRFKLRMRNIQKNNIRRWKPVVTGWGTDRTSSAYSGVIRLGRRLS